MYLGEKCIAYEMKKRYNINNIELKVRDNYENEKIAFSYCFRLSVA